MSDLKTDQFCEDDMNNHIGTYFFPLYLESGSDLPNVQNHLIF